MLIRKAAHPDWEQVVRLAGKCGLEYPGMETDDFWVAEQDGRVHGIVGLQRHAGCLELCALGVDPASRKRGVGRDLVFALLAGVREDVHLATVIPGYFERLGFERTAGFPPGMVKDPDWCAGCRRDLCTVMVRRGE
jgi:N-acetylglutamate synthase-like GNAT family acetyltransferase